MPVADRTSLFGAVRGNRPAAVRLPPVCAVCNLAPWVVRWIEPSLDVDATAKERRRLTLAGGGLHIAPDGVGGVLGQVRSPTGGPRNDARIVGRMKATVEEVQNGPAEYLHRVRDGETIVVYEGERAVAEIRPVTETDKLRPVGLAEGEFVVPEDFDDPLPDDLIDAFEGR